jgi:hypothetical protein
MIYNIHVSIASLISWKKELSYKTKVSALLYVYKYAISCCTVINVTIFSLWSMTHYKFTIINMYGA